MTLFALRTSMTIYVYTWSLKKRSMNRTYYFYLLMLSTVVYFRIVIFVSVYLFSFSYKVFLSIRLSLTHSFPSTFRASRPFQKGISILFKLPMYGTNYSYFIPTANVIRLRIVVILIWINFLSFLNKLFRS